MIHVAGTNGKGSTIAYLRAILEAAGLRVHVYTSPSSGADQRMLPPRPAPAAAFWSATTNCAARSKHCERANAGAPITIFEIETAAAFWLFAQHPADVVLLEVGLGGRLDATNVIDAPLATVIAPVSMDHTEFLGDTLMAIAREKAGIIKRRRAGDLRRTAARGDGRDRGSRPSACARRCMRPGRNGTSMSSAAGWSTRTIAA